MFNDLKFQQMPKFSECNYWYYPTTTSSIVCQDGNGTDADMLRYKQRPEYYIIQFYKEFPTMSSASQEKLIDMYETLLVGALFVRKYKQLRADIDAFYSKIQRCLEWLRSTDFYTCPASTKYHDSHNSGLLLHSLKVAYQALDLCNLNKFKSISIEDVVLVALIHDWGKIGQYEAYNKNIKNPETGLWEQALAYSKIPPAVPMGHEIASLYLAQKFFKLSLEESLAIRWHMGVWNTAPTEYFELSHANETYPMIHLLQFADQLAITNYT